MLHMAGARFPTWANNGNINMGTFGIGVGCPKLGGFIQPEHGVVIGCNPKKSTDSRAA